MNSLQLPSDIILDVFFLNTNIFLERNCLRTTIACSQVCTSWRSLLLSTTSIWGRLLHVGELLRMNDTGKREILARTGNSPLWVAGMLVRSGNDRDFIIHYIINANWARIEHFHLFIAKPTKIEFEPILQRPAPSLRSFDFSSHRWPLALGSDSKKPLLFFGQAPLLRIVAVNGLEPALSTLCLRRLRQLSISHSTSVLKVLTWLQSTLLLESLEVCLGGSVMLDDPTLPTAVLPNLARICLKSAHISSCTALLNSIQPAQRCTISFDADIISPSEQEILNRALLALSSYLKRYIHAHRSRIDAIRINLSDDHFLFQCHLKDFRVYTNSQHKEEEFRIWIKMPSDPAFTDKTLSLFPTLFSSCDFSHITKLIILDMPPHFCSSIAPIPILNYLPYFSSFPSVMHLVVNESTLLILLHISKNFHGGIVLFPLLETLTVGLFQEKLCRRRQYGIVRPVVKFLWHRQLVGLPVQKLVCDDLNDPSPDLEGLEELVQVGLVVEHTMR